MELRWAALVLLSTSAAFAQPAEPPARIEILLLDGRNGKPIAETGLFLFALCKGGHACSRVEMPGKKTDAAGRLWYPLWDELRALQIIPPSSYFTFCQDTGGNKNFEATFPVEQIIRTGVVAPNICSKSLDIQPQPGRLVFFLRPTHWWERPLIQM